MFNYPSVRTIELRILRNGRNAGIRVFDVAYRKIGGRGHTILRFKSPEYLRDNALLMIEAESGENHTWLYQPDEGAPRRVSTYQKADSFYGSDLSFEDIENRRWDNYSVRHEGRRARHGRSFLVVEAVPLLPSPYSRISVWIEADSLAIGRVEFYRHEELEPMKTMDVDLDAVTMEGDVFKPRLIRFELTGRDWATEVRFVRIEVSQGITEKAFTTMRLHAEGEDLFEMVNRLSK